MYRDGASVHEVGLDVGLACRRWPQRLWM